MSEQASVVVKKADRKPRRRMKAAYAKIREQMEFYFSDASLHKDRFLKKSIESTTDGYIPLETFLCFNKIKALTDDITTLTDALDKKSDLLQLNEKRTHVRRVTPITEPVDVDERTVYVECLPHVVNHEWVKKLFSPCGKVVYVSLPRYNTTGDMKGFAFVEFETIEGAQSACQELNNPPASFTNRAGMFPKSSHQLEALKKKIPDEQVKETQEKAMEIVASSLDVESKHDTSEQNNAENATKSSKLKRPRTDSESHADNDNAATEAVSSPAKRKKSEVSFNLPPEESKTEEEKTTPGTKKRAKKRKNRSRNSDEHISDSKDEPESEKSETIPEKKAKLDEKKDEKSVDSSNSAFKVIDKDSKDSKEGKKRFRRKKPKTEKEVPELRVLPKKEWLQLREEYLTLQKTSMAMLKKSLGNVKMSCHKDDDKEKEKHKEIGFVADVIVKVTAEHPMKRKDLKASLGEKLQIAYIDVNDDCQDGYIRCKDAESAKSISEKTMDGYSFSLVTGDEESDYWRKLTSDRETKLNTKSRHKKRGQQKWMDKAQKVSIENTARKHVVFDDND